MATNDRREVGDGSEKRQEESKWRRRRGKSEERKINAEAELD